MKRSRNHKVLLTGGHAATAALALIEKIVAKTKKNPWEISWIGVEKAIEGKKILTLESKFIPKTGIKSYNIFTGRIQRRFSVWTIPSLLKVPLGFFHALFLIKKTNPDIIVSLGGFASYPVVVAGAVFNIPIVLHEQTSSAGRANRFASIFASKIALARDESIDLFPRKKCVIVGNPVRKSILDVKPKKKIGISPTIYITGGSRGSVSINNFVEEILDKLLKDFLVIHHTGLLDFRKYKKIKHSLLPKLRNRYSPYSMINPSEVAKIFQRADIIISRAGANTVSEIMITKRPAILIPLPFAYLDEQRKNAEYAKKFGIASVFDQEEKNSNDLLEKIYEVKKNWNKIVSRVSDKESPDRSASEKLFKLIERQMQ